VKKKRAGKRPMTGTSSRSMQERCSNDNGTTSLYLSATTTTLTSYLAYLRQAMAMLHVVYASIPILLDIGGARLIRDLGGVISTW